MVRVDVRLRAFAGLLPGSRAVVVASGTVMAGVLVVFVIRLAAAIGVVSVAAVVVVSAQRFVTLVVLVSAVVVATVVKIKVDVASGNAGGLFPRTVLVRLLLAPSRQMA